MKSLKGSVLRAVSPDGRECRIKVLGFAAFGGKPSDERLARTGRVDIHVEELDDTGPVGLRWQILPG